MDQGACGWALPAGVAQFTEGQTVDRALVAKGRTAAVPVLWVGVRLATATQRRRLIAYTVTLREPVVRDLIGGPLPADVEPAARDLLAQGSRQGIRRLRDAGKALRGLARDRDAPGAPTPDQADAAIAATLRAAAAADGSHSAAEGDLVEWLSDELGLA